MFQNSFNTQLQIKQSFNHNNRDCTKKHMHDNKWLKMLNKQKYYTSKHKIKICYNKKKRNYEYTMVVTNHSKNNKL